jgi:hypothetical protein
MTYACCPYLMGMRRQSLGTRVYRAKAKLLAVDHKCQFYDVIVTIDIRTQ